MVKQVLLPTRQFWNLMTTSSGTSLQLQANLAMSRVVIAGDFQVAPEHYTAVTHAVHFHQWCDVLQFADEDGGFRPLTFSSNGCFTGPGDGCSSIDGIITNSVATAALTNAEVLPYLRVQHRPVRASFNWKVVWQRGFTLFKPAPFTLFPLPFRVTALCEDVSGLHHLSDVNQIWSGSQPAMCRCPYPGRCNMGAWSPNIEVFLSKTRPKNVCPGQCRSGARHYLTQFLAHQCLERPPGDTSISFAGNFVRNQTCHCLENHRQSMD